MCTQRKAIKMVDLVVLISGRMGSGKTTLRESLIDMLTIRGYDVNHYSFARPVYEAAAAVQQVLSEQYGVPMLKKDRALLQVIGTDWGRNTRDENIWVDCAREYVRRSKEEVVVIDDARFPNELLADFGCKTLIIRLEAAEAIRRERADSFGSTAHASESALDGVTFDFTIQTDEIDQHTTAEIAEEAVIRTLAAARVDKA